MTPWLLPSLVGCQEPFGSDRHDLVGFRIAALACRGGPEGTSTTPAAAMIVDGRPYADDPIAMEWTWLTEGDRAATVSRAPDAVGATPSLVLPAEPRRLLLVARHPALGERRALLEPSDDPAPPEFTLEVGLLPLDLADVEADQLDRDARLRVEAEGDGPVEPGGFARLTASFVAEATAGTRWMATAGTFLELDRHRSDWVAGDLRVDDGEVLDRRRLEGGLVTVVVLALDGRGANRWEDFDLPVGPQGSGLWAGGRWIPTIEAVAPGGSTRWITLVADDESPTGLGAVDVSDDPHGADAEDPWGTSALPCEGARGPFDPRWLLEGRCLRRDLDGARVRVELDP